MIDGNTEAALDYAFKALMEHKEDLGGEGSIFLLPALFILAEGIYNFYINYFYIYNFKIIIKN